MNANEKRVRRQIQGLAELAGSAMRAGHEIHINVTISDGANKGALADFFGFVNQASDLGDREQLLAMLVGEARAIDEDGAVGKIGLVKGIGGEFVSKFDYWDSLEEGEE